MKLNVSYAVYFEDADLSYIDEDELALMIADFIEEQLNDVNLSPSEITITRAEFEE